ncbi:MAG: thiol:disulfide interchange protein DsbA/DsbL [Pseudoxanthomonas sp.]
MKYHRSASIPALLSAAVLALAGCQQEAAPVAESVAPTAEVESAAPAPVESAAPAAGEAAAAPAESTPAEAAAPVPTPYAGPALVPGVDYTEVSGGQPFAPLDGKVEVVEFFNYICPACNAFNPQFESWKARQAADVRVTLVPATFRPDFAVYAKAFYAAESLGLVEKSHDAVYRAVHMDGKLPGEGQKIDEDKIVAFYTQYGVSADQFKNAMKSFAVNGKANKATQFMLRSQVGGTPSVLVNGKYMVKGRSWDDMIRITDGLVAQERAKAAAAAN